MAIKMSSAATQTADVFKFIPLTLFGSVSIRCWKGSSLCTAAPLLKKIDFFEVRGGCTQAKKDPKNPSPLWIIWINNKFFFSDFSKETKRPILIKNPDLGFSIERHPYRGLGAREKTNRAAWEAKVTITWSPKRGFLGICFFFPYNLHYSYLLSTFWAVISMYYSIWWHLSLFEFN